MQVPRPDRVATSRTWYVLDTNTWAGEGNRDAFHGPRGIFSHRDAWPVLEQFLMYRCLSMGTAPILSPARLCTPSQWGEGCQDPRGGAGCAYRELTPSLATGHPPWTHSLPTPKDPGRTDSAPVTLECQVGSSSRGISTHRCDDGAGGGDPGSLHCTQTPLIYMSALPGGVRAPFTGVLEPAQTPASQLLCSPTGLGR